MLAVLLIISREISARALKKGVFFSLRLDLAIEVNRYFLENEHSHLSFFFCFELSNKLLYVK